MALFEKLLPDFSFEDGRGKLTQLVHGGYTQINMLESRKGVFRGGHFHKQSREAFFVVSGQVEVTLKKGGEHSTELFHPGDFFEIAPYVVHSMRFPEDCVLVAMYDIPVEKTNGTKDIYKEHNTRNDSTKI